MSKEVRDLIVKADASGRSRKDIAEIFGVDRSTVSRLSKQMRETGSVELRTHERGRKQYLPAYSPDMNPIEKMWSKMKALLRKWKVRAIDMLPQAIAQALDAVSLDDCKGWFRLIP